MTEPILAEDLLGDRVRTELAVLAAQPRVLIACDYDGTVAELVDDPTRAWPRPEAIAALCDLAIAPDTHVAAISGRSRQELRRLSGLPDLVHLVGSHGQEFADDRVEGLDRSGLDRLDRIAEDLVGLADLVPGARVEHKPAAVVLHHRTVAAEHRYRLHRLVERFVERVRIEVDGPVHVARGRDVVEFAVVAPDKGAALERLRTSLVVDAVLFVGDDVTDESAFARLRRGDVGVKVGDGITAAAHRVADPTAVAALLRELAELRDAHLSGVAANANGRTSR